MHSAGQSVRSSHTILWHACPEHYPHLAHETANHAFTHAHGRQHSKAMHLAFWCKGIVRLLLVTTYTLPCSNLLVYVLPVLCCVQGTRHSCDLPRPLPSTHSTSSPAASNDSLNQPTNPRSTEEPSTEARSGNISGDAAGGLFGSVLGAGWGGTGSSGSSSIIMTGRHLPPQAPTRDESSGAEKHPGRGPSNLSRGSHLEPEGSGQDRPAVRLGLMTDCVLEVGLLV